MFINLHREAQTVYVAGRTQGYRMKVTATEAEGLPNEIFVYQRFPLPDVNGNPVDGFVNIASPADLEEYLVGIIGDPTMPFYRLDTVDMVFRNEEQLQKAWVGIQADVNELIRSLICMQNLGLVEDIPFGTRASSSSSA